MKINRINVEISTHANKHKPYLYNETYSLAKEHKFGGEFGTDYIELKGMPEDLTKELDKLDIKYRKLEQS